MKKVKLYISVFVLGTIVAFNLAMFNQDNSNNCFNLRNLKTAFADPVELPEHTITCDTGGEGVCYDEVFPPQLVYCGEISDYKTVCEATGDPNDSCEEFDPCE